MSVDIDATSDVVQARLARLALAYLSGDVWQSAAVWQEVLGDTRGSVTAMHELILATMTGLVESWKTHVEPSELTALLQGELAEIAARGGGSND